MALIGPVAEARALQPSGRLVVRVGEKEVVVLAWPGGMAAFANECPHLGARFDRGRHVGRTIECPAHRWRFDVRSGQVVRHWWQPTAKGCRQQATNARLTQYRVVLQGEEVFLDVPADEHQLCDEEAPHAVHSGL